MSAVVQLDFAGEHRSDSRHIGHLVVLGDALAGLLTAHEGQPEKLKSLFAPQISRPWTLTVLSAEELERQGEHVSLPQDASHVLICMEGIQAIESSGLLQTAPHSYEDALIALSYAADIFEHQVGRLIHVAQASRLPTVICTMHPPRYGDQRRQRSVFTALSVFNQRIMRRAFTARLPVVALALVCTDGTDYADARRLSKTGLRKVANVILSALYAAGRQGQQSEVFY